MKKMRYYGLLGLVLAASWGTRVAAQVSPGMASGPHNVILNGVRFFYSVGGTVPDAPPVVFLHGGPGQGSEHFEALGGGFLERELRVIYFDERGSGFSERP